MTAFTSSGQGPRCGQPAQLRRRRQGTTPVRLGCGHPARHRRRRARIHPLAAHPPVDHRPDRARLLPVLRAGRHQRRGTHPCGRRSVGRRGVLPDRQGAGRPGRLPGTPLRRVVPPHNPRSGRARSGCCSCRFSGRLRPCSRHCPAVPAPRRRWTMSSCTAEHVPSAALCGLVSAVAGRLASSSLPLPLVLAWPDRTEHVYAKLDLVLAT